MGSTVLLAEGRTFGNMALLTGAALLLIGAAVATWVANYQPTTKVKQRPARTRPPVPRPRPARPAPPPRDRPEAAVLPPAAGPVPAQKDPAQKDPAPEPQTVPPVLAQPEPPPLAVLDPEPPAPAAPAAPAPAAAPPVSGLTSLAPGVVPGWSGEPAAPEVMQRREDLVRLADEDPGRLVDVIRGLLTSDMAPPTRQPPKR